MLAIERKRKIISLLEERNSVLVPELSKIFNITEETVRRDLEKLEKEGLLKRTYGGAVKSENINTDLPLNIREVTNIEGKRRIGLKVAEYINDGDTIMLDSSSTALSVAESIKNKKKITVITNSVMVVTELADAKECNVISTGGNLRAGAMSFVGHMAENIIRNFNVDVSVVSCKGLNTNKEVTDSNEMEVEIKKAMVNSASKLFLVADYTKFDVVAFVKMIKFENIDILFTDKELTKEWKQTLINNGVQIVVC